MAKVAKYQATIWQDHTGTYTTCLLDDTDVVAVSKSRKQSIQQIKDYLQYAHKNGFAPEADFLRPKLTQLKTRVIAEYQDCLLYTSPSPRDKRQSRMPSSA